MSAENDMVRRFDFYYTNDFNYDYPAFSRECVAGEYVTYEDYAALRADVARLTAERDQMRAERDACMELRRADNERLRQAARDFFAIDEAMK